MLGDFAKASGALGGALALDRPYERAVESIGRLIDGGALVDRGRLGDDLGAEVRVEMNQAALVVSFVLSVDVGEPDVNTAYALSKSTNRVIEPAQGVLLEWLSHRDVKTTDVDPGR